MIYKEGGCIDVRHGGVWVRIEYDGEQDQALVVIKDRQGGRRLAVNGCSGPMAKRFYDRLNVYFFGYDRKTDSGY